MPLCIWVEDMEVRRGDLRWRACGGGGDGGSS